jgi:high-affinity nickel permease
MADCSFERSTNRSSGFITFGLRYAVDADHIAATDNVTRKLMETGKLP